MWGVRDDAVMFANSRMGQVCRLAIGVLGMMMTFFSLGFWDVPFFGDVEVVFMCPGTE